MIFKSTFAPDNIKQADIFYSLSVVIKDFNGSGYLNCGCGSEIMHLISSRSPSWWFCIFSKILSLDGSSSHSDARCEGREVRLMLPFPTKNLRLIIQCSCGIALFCVHWDQVFFHEKFKKKKKKKEKRGWRRSRKTRLGQTAPGCHCRALLVSLWSLASRSRTNTLAHTSF